MRIGVLELLVSTASRGIAQRTSRFVFARQLASVMPQAVAAWARRLGHRVHYAVYYGQRRPDRLLPADLDVVFVSCHGTGSALAYALAKLWRFRGVTTVIGGPHASSFPADCLRFFDIVVDRCDQEVVRRILEAPREVRGRVTTHRPLREVPGIEERLPEIRRSAMLGGRRYPATTIPLLASIGCPYNCDFCVDWDKAYLELPSEALAADLRFASEALPGVRLAFHDPNFGVRFDDVLEVIERIPPGRRNPYFMQCSLSILRDDRLPRLRDTRCVYIAPSLESWTDYSAKAGVGRRIGFEKLNRVVARIERLREHVPGIQVNFILGLDSDQGEEQLALTETFARRLPFVLPTATVVMPYGGTPLYDRIAEENRLLRSLPLAFYYLPHTAMVPAGDGVLELYDRLIGMFELMSSPDLLRRRMNTRLPRSLKLLHNARALASRETLAGIRRVRSLLVHDRGFRAFHEGSSTRLPEYYHERLDAMLGSFRDLLSRAERTPVHETRAATVAL